MRGAKKPKIKKVKKNNSNEVPVFLLPVFVYNVVRNVWYIIRGVVEMANLKFKLFYTYIKYKIL